jgi:hypothetical protein
MHIYVNKMRRAVSPGLRGRIRERDESNFGKIRQEMISALLLFFGVSLIYTGYLVSVQGQQLPAGLAIACIGVVLAVKPILYALRYYKVNFGGGPGRHIPGASRKHRTRKEHLKVVKSEDDNPTIH